MSAHGAKRTYRDDLLFVRFRAKADKQARVASTASVVNDPEPTQAGSKSRRALSVGGPDRAQLDSGPVRRALRKPGRAKIDQCLLGKPIRSGLTSLGEFNHLPGDDFIKPIVPVDNAKGCADLFVCEAHSSYRARIEFKVV
jgi:hypothetical protein